MVIIRLARFGSKKRPFYKIVVTDSRSPRDSKFIECIGFYNPINFKKNCLFIKIFNNRFIYWKNIGAKLSNTVKKIVKYYNKNIQ